MHFHRLKYLFSNGILFSNGEAIYFFKSLENLTHGGEVQFRTHFREFITINLSYLSSYM